MFYWLSFFKDSFRFLNLFSYQTVRIGGALLTAFVLTLFFMPKLIGWLKSKQAEQPIRKCGPETHYSKAGTPTMGGLMILGTTLVATLLWANLANPFIWVLLFAFLGTGLTGYWDDYTKLTRHSSDGIAGKTKLALQFAVAFITCGSLMYLSHGNMSTSISIPFFKNLFIDLGMFYVIFAMVVIVGASNAVNLTDGLDGLVSLPVIMCTSVFGVIAYLVGRVDYTTYLHIAYIPNAGEMAVMCGAIIGATLGFLWFNAHPAKVFMGDTGSLALGGFLGAIAVATKHELILAVAGGIFVVEALSDIIQVGSYKLRKKRVFLMAPIHHHFEKLGWSETTVVVRFWIVSILLALLALSTLKLR